MAKPLPITFADLPVGLNPLGLLDEQFGDATDGAFMKDETLPVSALDAGAIGNGLTIDGTSIAIDTSVTADLTSAQTLENKTLVTPDLGTPSAIVLTNATGLPLAAMPEGTTDVPILGNGASAPSYRALPLNGAGVTGLLPSAKAGAAQATTRTVLAGIDATKNTVAWLQETGRQGWFQWNSANLSALVTADTQQGVYVAPTSDPTGASGAWVRQFDGILLPPWCGALGNGSADDSAKLNATLSLANTLASGRPTVVDGAGLNYAIASSVTVPANVEFRNYTVTHLTAGMNGVLVNTGAKLFGSHVGTGTTNIIERGVYPAANNVTDVELGVIVSDMTVGVHGQPLTGTAYADAPKRWYGIVRAENIVGAPGVSEGYGVLLSPACDTNLLVYGTNVERHIYYISAGACGNKAVVHADTVYNFAIQIETYVGQDESAQNDITLFGRNLKERTATGPEQSGGIAIVQNSNRNVVRLFIEGDGNSAYAAQITGASGGPYPIGNKIIDGSISGHFTGSDVIQVQNADSTVVARNNINAYATYDVIGFRIQGTFAGASGGLAYDNVIDAQAQNVNGIYAEATTAPTYIGPNQIGNNGTGSRVLDNTSGKRTGSSRTLQFTGTSPSITAGNDADVSVALAEAIQTTGSNAVVSMTGASASFFENAWVGATFRPDATHINVRCFNGGTVAKAISFAGTIYGD